MSVNCVSEYARCPSANAIEKLSVILCLQVQVFHESHCVLRNLQRLHLNLRSSLFWIKASSAWLVLLSYTAFMVLLAYNWTVYLSAYLQGV